MESRHERGSQFHEFHASPWIPTLKWSDPPWSTTLVQPEKRWPRCRQWEGSWVWSVPPKKIGRRPSWSRCTYYQIEMGYVYDVLLEKSDTSYLFCICLLVATQAEKYILSDDESNQVRKSSQKRSARFLITFLLVVSTMSLRICPHCGVHSLKRAMTGWKHCGRYMSWTPSWSRDYHPPRWVSHVQLLITIMIICHILTLFLPTTDVWLCLNGCNYISPNLLESIRTYIWEKFNHFHIVSPEMGWVSTGSPINLHLWWGRPNKKWHFVADLPSTMISPTSSLIHWYPLIFP